MTIKEKWYSIIFKNDSKEGRIFDVTLLIIIITSVFVVLMDSVTPIHNKYYKINAVLEWFFTISFTLEYITRISVHPKPLRYVFSFWGIIDLLSIVPTYFGLFYQGYQYLLVVRILRLFRMFRIFKLVRFSNESKMLLYSLRASLYKISIFFMALLFLVIIMGTVMYVVEGENSFFSSIPQGIYWAVITITTVGYGDIVPQTVIGKFIATFSMIVGYSIIAIPTGIVSAEMTKSKRRFKKECPKCHTRNSLKARFCDRCGKRFEELIKEEIDSSDFEEKMMS